MKKFARVSKRSVVQKLGWYLFDEDYDAYYTLLDFFEGKFENLKVEAEVICSEYELAQGKFEEI